MYVWMSRIVALTNRKGEVGFCKIGFSWTILFFMLFVPLYRRDWLGLVLYVLAAYFTNYWSILLFPFFYNRLYITQLLFRGWQPASFADWEMLKANRFFVKDWVGPSNPNDEFDPFRRQNGAYADQTSRSERGKNLFDGEDMNASHDKWQRERDNAVDVEWHDDDGEAR